MIKDAFIKVKNTLKIKHKKPYDMIRATLFPMYIKFRNQSMSRFKGKFIKDIEFEKVKYKLLLDHSNGFVDQEIFWKGVYEEEVMSCIKEQVDYLLKVNHKEKIKDKEVVKCPIVFLDIGCNIGQELIFVSAIDERVKAIGFEPLSFLCNQINESIKINNFKNAKVYNVALGDRDEELAINIPKINIGGSSIVRDERNTDGEYSRIIIGLSLFSIPS